MLRETTQTAEFGTYPSYSSVKSGMGALETAAFRNTNFSVSFSSECGLKKCRARERKDSPEGAMYGASWVDPVAKISSARTSSKTPSNAIWLCQNCTKPFDIDPIHSPLELQQMFSEPRTNGDRL